MNIILLTFGGGDKRYHDAKDRLVKQAEEFGLFNKIIGYTEQDLIYKYPEFWNKHSNFILNNKRGYGYWIWKSYIILDILKTLNENDILVYLDCGCEINITDESKNRFLEYINIVKEHNNLLFHLEDKHKEIHWNKLDLLIHMNFIKFYSVKEGALGYEFDQKLFKSQAESGMQFYKKCDKNIKLLEESCEICSNYHLIDDTISYQIGFREFKEFIEHRHDQSVLSLLFKKYDYMTVLDETYPPTMIGDKKRYPIWAIRNYSSESKIKYD
jgi:hypothetical protein